MESHSGIQSVTSKDIQEEYRRVKQQLMNQKAQATAKFNHTFNKKQRLDKLVRM
jgi:hypothetical protein